MFLSLLYSIFLLKNGILFSFTFIYFFIIFIKKFDIISYFLKRDKKRYSFYSTFTLKFGLFYKMNSFTYFN